MAFTLQQKLQAKAILENQSVAAFVASIGGTDNLGNLFREMRADTERDAQLTLASSAFTLTDIDWDVIDAAFSGGAPRNQADIGAALETALASHDGTNLGALLIAFAAASGVVRRA